MAKADKATDTGEKPKKQKKEKKRRGRGEADAEGASVSRHPRARMHVRAAKGWCGLIFFLLGGLFALKAGDPGFQVLVWALGSGVIGLLLGWACAVMVWRQLLVAEQRYHVDQLKQQWEEAEERRAAAAEAAAKAEEKQTARQK